MRILTNNLRTALWIAIQQRQNVETEQGYTKESSLVAGWREIVAAIDRGEHISVSDT